MKLNIQLTLSDFKSQMHERGWVIFPELISLDFVEKMNRDMELAYKICRSIQVKNGVDKNTEFTLHHLIGQGDTFLQFLRMMEGLNEYFEAYFEGKYILNSMGGAINSARSRSYAHNIHRDIRSYSGSLPLLLNTLFMLDDFTEENGATYLMEGSHMFKEKPSEEEFAKKQVRALGKAGSLLVFNSNVWHRGGDNNTDVVRRSITPMYCKPYVKSQYDYSRYLGYDKVVNLSGFEKQMLGYYSRVPTNLDEWYQPPESRMYRPDQG